MDERLQFVARRLAGEPMAELCREFAISRKTGYKIFDRYQDDQRELVTHRVSGDQKVISTYWLSHGLKICPNFTGDFGVSILEKERMDGTCKAARNTSKHFFFEFSTQTLCNSVPEFKQGDGRRAALVLQTNSWLSRLAEQSPDMRTKILASLSDELFGLL